MRKFVLDRTSASPLSCCAPTIRGRGGGERFGYDDGAVQLGGLVHEAQKHNTGSYLTTTTAQLFQLSIQSSDSKWNYNKCGRGRLFTAQLRVFHQNITCSIHQFPF